MAYLYLEHLLLYKMIDGRELFSNVMRDAFKKYVLQEQEKKRLIFDLKNILKSYQKLSFLELNLFTKYKRNSKEFFINLITIYHVKKMDFNLSQMHEFYIKHFDFTFDVQEKEDNFNKISTIPSDFLKNELSSLDSKNYASIILEIPSFIYDKFCNIFSKDEIENLSYSFYHEMNDYYLLISSNKKR